VSDYNLGADILSKFQSSPMVIQALWLVAVPVTVLTPLYFVKEICVAALRKREGGASDGGHQTRADWREPVLLPPRETHR
jgi:hypothetical protein